MQYRLKVGKGDLKIFWWTGLKVPMANQISEFLKQLFQERWGSVSLIFCMLIEIQRRLMMILKFLVRHSNKCYWSMVNQISSFIDNLYVEIELMSQ